MTNVKILFAVALLSSLCSCSRSDDLEEPNEVYFTKNIRVYPAGSFQADTIGGELLIPEVIGGRMFASGEGFIVIKTSDSPIFRIYSQKGDSIGAYGIEGQGPDDFLPGNSLGSTVMADNGERVIWVNDINGRAMKRLNIDRSIAKGQAVVDSVAPTVFGAVNTVMAGDLMVMEEMSNNGYTLKIRDLSQPTDTYRVEQVYVYPTDNFYLFRSNFSVSPDNRHLAIGMHNFNQMNIFELGDMSRKAVSLGNVRKPADAFDLQKSWTRYNEYSGVAAANDAAYGLYLGKEDEAIREDFTEIHRISYDGQLTGRFIVKRMLKSIAADNSADCLYGMDSDDNIFIYKMK